MYKMQIHNLLSTKESPCDGQNRQQLEEIYHREINKRLDCNIPWSRFKLKNLLDCSSNDQMKRYFEIARQADTLLQADQLVKNCQRVKWIPRDFFTDLAYEPGPGNPFIWIGIGGLNDFVSIF